MVRRRDAVVRRGLRHVRRAIVEQPGMFTLAVAASSLYGAMTVASAWVIGEITDRVLLPAFEDGETTTAALSLAAAAIIAVALLKIVGILGRRLFAGIMSYRLQADYRRRVTRQYLRLPLSWHQKHPTGQLLSNANSDVEASWFFVAPLPFACGALVMIAITVVALFLIDPWIALVGLVVFPLVFLVNIVYSQVMSPRMQRAQQLRAEVSEIAHESFDAALVVKTLGREARGDRALRGPRRRAARRADRRRPGARPVRPADGGPAEPGHPRRPADRCRPGRRRQHRRRQPGLHRLPLHPAGAAHPRHRLGAGRPASGARRIRPGHPGARGHR